MKQTQVYDKQYSTDIENLLSKEFDKKENIISIIENKKNNGYKWDETKMCPIENSPCTELYIICERNNDYYLNYYYRNDNLISDTKYHFEKMIQVKNLRKFDDIYKFLKQHSLFNNDKILKSILLKIDKEN